MQCSRRCTEKQEVYKDIKVAFIQQEKAEDKMQEVAIIILQAVHHGQVLLEDLDMAEMEAHMLVAAEAAGMADPARTQTTRGTTTVVVAVVLGTFTHLIRQKIIQADAF